MAPSMTYVRSLLIPTKYSNKNNKNHNEAIVDSTSSPSSKNINSSCNMPTKKLVSTFSLKRNHNSSGSLVSITTASTSTESYDFLSRTPFSNERTTSKVLFHEKPQIAYVLARKDYTQEELESTFYTSQDYANFTDNVNKEIGKMQNGKRLKDRKYCARGLERYGKEGQATHRSAVQMCVQAVLHEQQEMKQQIMQEEDSENINIDAYHDQLSRISQCASARSLSLAQARGCQDKDYVDRKAYRIKLLEKENKGMVSKGKS